MSGISLFAVMAVGILFMGLFVWLLVLVIRALPEIYPLGARAQRGRGGQAVAR